MNSNESPTPGEKADLHRTRFELGQQMALRLGRRSLNEGHDTVHGREAVDLDEMRHAVWRAENDALRVDPKQAFLPDDIRQQRNRGMSE